jgi:hypothetical protein
VLGLLGSGAANDLVVASVFRLVVRGAKFRNTKLFGANFNGAKGMTMDQVRSARIDLATVLPAHLRDPFSTESSQSVEADDEGSGRGS